METTAVMGAKDPVLLGLTLNRPFGGGGGGKGACDLGYSTKTRVKLHKAHWAVS